jgi:hypothetical protein
MKAKGTAVISFLFPTTSGPNHLDGVVFPVGVVSSCGRHLTFFACPWRRSACPCCLAPFLLSSRGVVNLRALCLVVKIVHKRAMRTLVAEVTVCDEAS